MTSSDDVAAANVAIAELVAWRKFLIGRDNFEKKVQYHESLKILFPNLINKDIREIIFSFLLVNLDNIK